MDPSSTVAKVEPVAVLEVACRRELERHGRLETLEGAVALLLARSVDAAPAGTTIVSSLVKEFRSSMAEALRGVSTGEPDHIDRLRARRDEKLAR